MGRLQPTLDRLPAESAEYQAQRRRLEAQLAELPLPADANLLAFNRAAASLLPFANMIRGTPKEHQRAILPRIVERVAILDGEVIGITIRPEARPFFSDSPAAAAWRPRTDSNRRRQP